MSKQQQSAIPPATPPTIAPVLLGLCCCCCLCKIFIPVHRHTDYTPDCILAVAGNFAEADIDSESKLSYLVPRLLAGRIARHSLLLWVLPLLSLGILVLRWILVLRRILLLLLCCSRVRRRLRGLAVVKWFVAHCFGKGEVWRPSSSHIIATKNDELR
jgi:hypothetical protein